MSKDTQEVLQAAMTLQKYCKEKMPCDTNCIFAVEEDRLTKCSFMIKAPLNWPVKEVTKLTWGDTDV